jgi:hypothetical protein
MNNKRNNITTVPSALTIGVLKEIIQDMPDNAEVCVDLIPTTSSKENTYITVTDAIPIHIDLSRYAETDEVLDFLNIIIETYN